MVCVLVLCCCVLISKIALAEISAKDVATRLQNYYEQTKNFTADFEQEVHFLRANQIRFSKGRVYFEKPGLMRWEYTWPEELLIVADKKNIYVYSKKDNQVMIFPKEKSLSSKLMLSFVSGKGNIFEDFRLGPVEELPEGKVALILFPKEEAQIQKIKLLIDKKNGALLGFSFWDQLGNLTRIKFLKTKRNIHLAKALFNFEPPKGAEIIQER